MPVRAKFIVNTITRSMGSWWNAEMRENEPREAWSIKMYPVTPAAGSPEEDRKFWLATPSGSIELSTVNPAAAEEFADNLGRAVYVDFSRAD